MVRIGAALVFGFLSTFVSAVPLETATAAAFDIKQASKDYVAKQWGVSSYYDVWFERAETNSKGQLAVLYQQVNSQPAWNSYANVQYDTSNQVVSFEGKHFPVDSVEVNLPTIEVEEAVAAAEKALNAKWTDKNFDYNEPYSLGYIVVGTRAKYVYILHFKSNTDGHAFTAYISAVDGQVDWVN